MGYQWDKVIQKCNYNKHLHPKSVLHCLGIETQVSYLLFNNTNHCTTDHTWYICHTQKWYLQYCDRQTNRSKKSGPPLTRLDALRPPGNLSLEPLLQSLPAP